MAQQPTPPTDEQLGLIGQFMGEVFTPNLEVRPDNEINFDATKAIVGELYRIRTGQNLIESDPIGLLDMATRGHIDVVKKRKLQQEVDFEMLERITAHNAMVQQTERETATPGALAAPRAPEQQPPRVDAADFMGLSDMLQRAIMRRIAGTWQFAVTTTFIHYLDNFRHWRDNTANRILRNALDGVIRSTDYLVNRFGQKMTAAYAAAGAIGIYEISKISSDDVYKMGSHALKGLNAAAKSLADNLSSIIEYLSNVGAYERVNPAANKTNTTNGSWTNEGKKEADDRHRNNDKYDPSDTDKLMKLIKDFIKYITDAKIDPNDLKNLKGSLDMMNRNTNNPVNFSLFAKQHENSLLSILKRKIGDQLKNIHNPSMYSAAAIQNRSTSFSTNTWHPVGYPNPPF